LDQQVINVFDVVQ